MKAHVGAEV